MSFFNEDYNDLIRIAIKELQYTTKLTNFSPGAKAQALLLAMNKQYKKMCTIFDLNAIQSFVAGASGMYLDYIGQLVGIVRLTANSAVVDRANKNIRLYTDEVNFGLINNGNPIPVPKNTSISSNPGPDGSVITYFTTEDILLAPNVNYTYVSAKAANTGDTYNVGSGTLVNLSDLIQYADKSNKSLKVTNVGTISNGSDDEDDDHYRFRIINNRLTGEAANETAVRLALLSIPGIADLVFQPYYRGIGTTDIILQSNTGFVSQDLINTAQGLIDNNIKAVGNYIYIRAPLNVGIQTYITITYRSGTSSNTIAQINNGFVNNYRSFLTGKKIGDPLIINEIISLFPISDPIVNIGQPNQPLDLVYMYKDSPLSVNQRMRIKLVKDYNCEYDEKLVPEYSVDNPLNITSVI